MATSGFMGKKVNLFLLLMLLLVLLGFGGATVYYQYTFKDVNNKYNTLSTNLGICEQNLSHTTTSLLTTLRNLNSTETDIRKYDLLYEQKAGELKEKADELGDVKADLTRTTLQKEVYKKQADAAYTRMINLNKTIESKNKQINSLNSQIDDRKDEIACLLSTDDGDEYDCI